MGQIERLEEKVNSTKNNLDLLGRANNSLGKALERCEERLKLVEGQVSGVERYKSFIVSDQVLERLDKLEIDVGYLKERMDSIYSRHNAVNATLGLFVDRTRAGNNTVEEQQKKIEKLTQRVDTIFRWHKNTRDRLVELEGAKRKDKLRWNAMARCSACRNFMECETNRAIVELCSEERLNQETQAQMEKALACACKNFEVM